MEQHFYRMCMAGDGRKRAEEMKKKVGVQSGHWL